MDSPSDVAHALLGLAHDLGREDRGLAILGEGNVSARDESDTFLVKASGSSLGTLASADLTACRHGELLALLDRESLSDAEVDEALLASRIDPAAKKPSVEAVFHAYLLSLPGVNFVGHTHPTTVNGILCSPHAATLAARRLFPDEIVCCGEESVLVPYTDPGLILAQAIRRETAAFISRRGAAPRVILLASHGLIALGATPAAVIAATLMAEKAARILVAALAVSGSAGPHFLTDAQIARIAGRPDEHHRRRALGL